MVLTAALVALALNLPNFGNPEAWGHVWFWGTYVAFPIVAGLACAAIHESNTPLKATATLAATLAGYWAVFLVLWYLYPSDIDIDAGPAEVVWIVAVFENVIVSFVVLGTALLGRRFWPHLKHNP